MHDVIKLNSYKNNKIKKITYSFYIIILNSIIMIVWLAKLLYEFKFSD